MSHRPMPTDAELAVLRCLWARGPPPCGSFMRT